MDVLTSPWYILEDVAHDDGFDVYSAAEVLYTQGRHTVSPSAIRNTDAKEGNPPLGCRMSDTMELWNERTHCLGVNPKVDVIEDVIQQGRVSVHKEQDRSPRPFPPPEKLLLLVKRNEVFVQKQGCGRSALSEVAVR